MSKPYLFIHINKTGGCSIRAALKIPQYHEVLKVHTIHQRLEEFYHQKNIDDVLTFAFVRNPFAKVVSHYHYRLKIKFFKQPISFKQFVTRTYGLGVKGSYWRDKMFMPQCHWLDYGTKTVGFVGRVENMNDDFNSLCKDYLKVPSSPLPHINKSTHDGYRTYYDKDTKRIIRHWFKQDFERFDYRF